MPEIKEENFLKNFRKKRKLTQKELSARIGYSIATIKLYEKKNIITEKVLDKLILYFELEEEERKKITVNMEKENVEVTFLKKLEELKIKERYLDAFESKLKREEINLKKEKTLLYLEENKSDYLKIKDVLIELKSIIGELDIKSALSLDIKQITKKEIAEIINKNIQELHNIKKRFDNNLVEEIIYDDLK
ncbi:MAG: helix-turn-helix domain-containing protein [Clostridium sp.]